MADTAVKLTKAKLTKAQKRVLLNIDAMGLHRHFDVWGGYYWTQGVRNVTGRTAEVLAEIGVIGVGKPKRAYPGHTIQHAELTDKGRALLDALKDEGEGR